MSCFVYDMLSSASEKTLSILENVRVRLMWETASMSANVTVFGTERAYR